MDNPVYILTLLLGLVGCILFLLWLFPKRAMPSALTLSVICGSILTFTLCVLLASLSPEVNAFIVSRQLQFVCMLILSPLWVCFVTQYIRRSARFPRPSLVFCCLLISLGLVTMHFGFPSASGNAYTVFANSSATLSAIPPLPFIWLGSLYCLLLQLTSWVIIARAVIARMLTKVQMLLLMACSLIPLAANLASAVFTLDPNLSPAGFLAILPLLFAAFRSRYESEIQVQGFHLLNMIDKGIVFLSRDRRIVGINQAGESLLDIIGAKVLEQPANEALSHLPLFDESGALLDSSNFEYYGDNGGKRTINFTRNSYSFTKRVTGGTILIFSDVTDLLKARSQLDYIHNYDDVTGLINQSNFLIRLDEEILRAKHGNATSALIHININDFRDINSVMGRRTGDELLNMFAKRLLLCLRGTDLVSRFTADEFYILMVYSCEEDASVELALERIQRTLKAPFVVGDTPVEVSCRAGIAMVTSKSHSSQRLLSLVEAAQLQAKKQSATYYVFASEELEARAYERHILVSDIFQALDRNEFYLCYQPQVDVQSRKVIGVEALLRWRHGKLGEISPDRFIPVAEDTGVIVPLGKWVMSTSLSQLKAWHDMGYQSLQMSINVSPVQLRDDSFVTTVIDTIRQSCVPCELVELEITESTALHIDDAVLFKLNALCSTGIRLAIDDFGMGHTSLRYIQKLPISTLKIDKILSSDVEHNSISALIIEAIATMCKALKVTLLTEFIESREQLDCLIRLGCNCFQGYYFSRPLLADVLPDYAVEIQKKLDQLEAPADIVNLS